MSAPCYRDHGDVLRNRVKELEHRVSYLEAEVSRKEEECRRQRSEICRLAYELQGPLSRLIEYLGDES